MTENNAIYLVIQHQALSEYDNHVVFACASREVAEYAAGKLNKEYASSGVKLDKNNLFVSVSDKDLMGDTYHYYDVICRDIKQTKEDLNKYL